MGRETVQTFFKKKIYKWPTSKCKGAQHQYPLGKSKSKPQ